MVPSHELQPALQLTENFQPVIPAPAANEARATRCDKLKWIIGKKIFVIEHKFN